MINGIKKKREREREREREFNRTFVSLYDVDSRDDKKRRRQNQWEAHLRKNNNQTQIEPIDYFYPNATNLANTLVNDCTINGKKTYVRVLICRKEELNNNQAKIEPIDCFYPLSMPIGGCMNSPKDTMINGIKKYARVLIRNKNPII